MIDTRPYILVYHAGYEIKIKNTESLPHGTGAKFLKCIIAHNGDFVAHSWHKKEPELQHGYMAFSFPK